VFIRRRKVKIFDFFENGKNKRFCDIVGVRGFILDEFLEVKNLAVFL
jgi:hypothetical protein